MQGGDRGLQIQLIEPSDPESVDFEADSVRLVLFDDVAKIRATDKDFNGRWEYSRDGNMHQRVFKADHTAEYFYNGALYSDFDDSTWRVENNVLTLKLAATGAKRSTDVFERHLSRNRKELIFESLPYRNGNRVVEESPE
jgi:hypothetical protein